MIAKIGVKWYLIVVLIYISLITNAAELFLFFSMKSSDNDIFWQWTTYTMNLISLFFP